MLDRVSEENCDEADMVTKHFNKLSLDAPGYTPWFDTWMKLYLQTLPVVDHEFLRHSLGVIFVVSTKCKQPVEAFRQLSANQQRQQHDRSSWSYPVYFSPNILKYYVLVHDTYSDIEDSKAQEMFTMVQNAFDSSSCCFLPLNSRAPDSESSNANIAEHWMAFSHRWCSVEARRGKSFTSGMATSPQTTNISPPSPSLSHPLATPSDSPDHVVTGPKLTQVRPNSLNISPSYHQHFRPPQRMWRHS